MDKDVDRDVDNDVGGETGLGKYWAVLRAQPPTSDEDSRGAQ